MIRPLSWFAALAAAGAAACSPTLDWREFVPEGSALSMTFPCRADRLARSVVVVGAKVQMQMLVCSAGDATWAVSFFDVADPAQVSATLSEWRANSVANVQGAVAASVPVRIKGMTPNEQAVRVAFSGKLPDAASVQEHAAFFTRGLRVYAATVIGAKPAPQAVEVFFAGLKFPT